MGEEVVGAVVAIQIAVDHHGSRAVFCRHPEHRPELRIEEDLGQGIDVGSVLAEPPWSRSLGAPPSLHIVRR
ncbi:hypothetical protein ACWDF1_09865 [Streptomyces coelicoflavus]|uniref:hypothetical protein n=1 Tax=Streptomyces coelicoflavus TaxID=285562 RepID=UPI00131F2187|nr:hypothetical protein [Streptomyces coelicoflavus]